MLGSSVDSNSPWLPESHLVLVVIYGRKSVGTLLIVDNSRNLNIKRDNWASGNWNWSSSHCDSGWAGMEHIRSVECIHKVLSTLQRKKSELKTCTGPTGSLSHSHWVPESSRSNNDDIQLPQVGNNVVGCWILGLSQSQNSEVTGTGNNRIQCFLSRQLKSLPASGSIIFCICSSFIWYNRSRSRRQMTTVSRSCGSAGNSGTISIILGWNRTPHQWLL